MGSHAPSVRLLLFVIRRCVRVRCELRTLLTNERIKLEVGEALSADISVCLAQIHMHGERYCCGKPEVLSFEQTNLLTEAILRQTDQSDELSSCEA